MALSLFDTFSVHLKNVIRQAATLASALHHTDVRPEHLLYGLATQKGSISTEILTKAGVTAEALKEQIIQQQPVSFRTEQIEPDALVMTTSAKKAIERAVVIANQHDHRYVGTEHLLMGLLALEDSTVIAMLRTHQVLPADMQQHLVSVLKNTSKFPDLTSMFEQAKEQQDDMMMSPPRGAERGSALETYCTDLTDAAAQETIDPVIGRDTEIERLIHILSRRTKNNPILIGDPGVGKTAIVEGLAKRIAEHNVPEVLAEKRILSLDLSLIVAGTVYRGEFENRLKQVIDEVKADANVILFIDEVHTVIGAGGASGSLDAANILKPALAKGQLRCIGATTSEEYHKHIESDPALERRFQPILVQEPSAEETVGVLEGLRTNYETYHNVAITDDAIRAAVELSVRYVQDKALPDKAIDLVDEAASKVKVQNTDATLAKKIRAIEEQLDALHEQKHEAINKEDFTRAIDHKDAEDALLTELKTLREAHAKASRQRLGKITAREITDVVARMTGIPVGELAALDQVQLLDLENRLQQRIVGQDAAVHAISAAIRRSRTGLSNPNRPLGSFIFLGPSGVGKTETAKELARTIFGDAKALLQFDMSEFSESFQASKLVGAPPGYVGYKEGAKLTEGVKRKPYSVVLFDEIEKAHPDLFNLLLQVLDEGHLTDATGKKINFKNTIIIMTSNVGLKELTRQASIGFSENGNDVTYKQVEERVLSELKQKFRPEFLNRVDNTIVFRPLTSVDIRKIVDIKLAELAARAQKRGLAVRADLSAKKHLAQKGVNAEQGARLLQRVLQDEVEQLLADHLLRRTGDSSAVTITEKDGQIRLK